MRYNKVNSCRSQGGFTLVEMAIVLAVIGLILGAVMIGKDVQRNAEFTKIKQKFVDQWVVSYNSFHSRAGLPVGDDKAAPTLMVNGAGGGSGDELCGNDLREEMLSYGISMPSTGGNDNENLYTYLDSNGNPNTLEICFVFNQAGTDSGSGNVMVIKDVTSSLARFLDQSIDGTANQSEGVFRDEDTDGTPGEWATRADTTVDDDAEDLFTVHYKMNQ